MPVNWAQYNGSLSLSQWFPFLDRPETVLAAEHPVPIQEGSWDFCSGNTRAIDVALIFPRRTGLRKSKSADQGGRRYGHGPPKAHPHSTACVGNNRRSRWTPVHGMARSTTAWHGMQCSNDICRECWDEHTASLAAAARCSLFGITA